MDNYSKVVNSKLKFKGTVLPEKSKLSTSKKKHSKKNKADVGADKYILKQGEEKDYHEVPEDIDYRTDAERRFDEHTKQQDKDFIYKRSTMSYQDVVDELNAKLEKMTDHNDMPRIAAAGLG